MKKIILILLFPYYCSAQHISDSIIKEASNRFGKQLKGQNRPGISVFHAYTIIINNGTFVEPEEVSLDIDGNINFEGDSLRALKILIAAIIVHFKQENTYNSIIKRKDNEIYLLKRKPLKK